MCKWGTDTDVKLCKTKPNGWDVVPVDSCIAPLVQALNDAGIETTHACCGHGNGDGDILLADGRRLVVESPTEEV